MPARRRPVHTNASKHLRETPATVNDKPGSKQKESDLGVAPEPVDSAENPPDERSHSKRQGDSEGPVAEIENPRARAKKVIPPRSPLPKRINRVTNPAAPDMPRAKRTSAEVAAAKAEKAQLLQRLDELNKQNKLALAEMEINEEEEEAREERTVVRRIEDLVPEAHNEVCPVHPVEPRDDELEEFPMDEDEPLSIQDEKDEPSRLEGERIDVQIQPVKRKKKPAKGETRKAVEEMKAELRGKKGACLDQVENDSDDSEVSTPRPHKRVKETRPSGLVKNWEQKAIGITRGGVNRVNRRESSPRDGSAPSGVPLGGLADEDTFSERPSSKASRGRNMTRKNEIVHVTDSDSEASSEAEITSRPSSRPTSHRKAEAPSARPNTQVRLLGNIVKSGRSSGKKNNRHDVPRFVQADWSTRFLPTLYHTLFSAEKPFHDFSKGTGLIDIVQQVLDIVHPKHTYVVAAESKLYLNAYDRLVEKRSEFGTRAIRVVEKFFEQPEFKGKPSAISKYAKWATGRDGPALWGIPARQGSLPQDEDYIAPKKLFESQHMIDVLTWLIKKPIENSQLPELGYPKGAVALAAASVERAFLAFHSGQKVHASPFSRDSHGAIVADYMENLRAFSDRRWTSLLAACGVMDGAAAETFGGPLLDSARHRLYIPSSP